MLRIALCDDMRSFLDEAKVHIERWPDKPDDLITELFESGDALLCAHEANPFDIIFLDGIKNVKFLIYIWGYSSVGRAPALQAGGQEFDSPYLHHVRRKFGHKSWTLTIE